jgi:MYXO-CTERM domain-containing protein
MVRRFLLLSAILLTSNVAAAADIAADPANYLELLPTLKPGDTLVLAAGTYTGGLPISNLEGSDAAWITIRGPASGAPAIFEGNGCCNTVELVNASYVAIENLTIDGKGIDGAFGVSAKNSSNNVVHHIRIEGNTFVGQNASQQNVAISTKTPTYGWIIRRNIIDGAGTGLYLGNSNYAEPFVGGVIEYNLVRNTIGYNMQIKNQNVWPMHPALTNVEDSRTIIRHNVFIKDDAPSPDGVRPNVFLGGPPPSGEGSSRLVEVYGNLFLHNANESLLQATGRVAIHDNIFVDASDIAIRLATHDGFPLIGANVYDNTFYLAKRAISLGSTSNEGDIVTGNLIFADVAFDGPFMGVGTNLVDTAANAANYVNKPSVVLGEMVFYPLPSKVETGPIGPDQHISHTDHACDFNGASKKMFTFRGAYAGAGTNPGWKLANERKPDVVCQPSSGAGGSGSSSSGDGGMGGMNVGGTGGSGGAGNEEPIKEIHGCGCRTTTTPNNAPLALAVALLALGVSRRNRAASKTHHDGHRAVENEDPS